MKQITRILLFLQQRTARGLVRKIERKARKEGKDKKLFKYPQARKIKENSFFFLKGRKLGSEGRRQGIKERALGMLDVTKGL